jgi:RNA polymerase sigma-70 factor (ECF subfamily)
MAVDCKNKPNDEAQTAQCVQLITSYQLDIQLFVRSLVLDMNEVAEIVQETNLVLWEKRDQFATIQNFRAWAFQIARYKLLERQAQRKRKGLCFSDAIVDQLAIQASDATADDDLLDDLNRCIARLPAQDHELLTQRYSSQASCESIAKAIGRPVRWVYKALNRIRQELFDCISQSANAWRER